jgi:hypothetical protein
MGEVKARARWTSEHLYKRIKDTYSGTFDGRKVAVLRSHTSHKTVRQSVCNVIISGLPTIHELGYQFGTFSTIHPIREDQQQKERSYENRGHYRKNPAGFDVSCLWA